MNIEIIDEKSYKNILDFLFKNIDIARIFLDNFIKSYKHKKSSNQYILKANVSQKKKEDIEFICFYFDKTRALPNVNYCAKFLRKTLAFKNVISLFAYNSTGKTRLSTEFKQLGKKRNKGDTLYYNAYTEDLFTWNNDLKKDKDRYLTYNKKSKFFKGIDGLSIEDGIRKYFHRFSDIDMNIDTSKGIIYFKRKIGDETIENIKISRGEERLFIFCFFLAILEVAIIDQDNPHSLYNWVKYVFIDDPVSSLDDNNIVIMMALLADLIKKSNNKLKFVITTHHSLFFNLLSNNFKDVTNDKYFMMLKSNKYIIKNTNDIPAFYHISIINMLKEAVKKDDLYQYHFHFLRILFEKIASFLGYENFTDCLEDGEDKEIHKKLLNVSSHGGYLVYEPDGMNPFEKKHFCNILKYMINTYKFNKKGINCNRYNNTRNIE